MLGTDFARTMRAAQAGEEDAFVRLWRDANPAMIRYLRVVGHDDPYDEACEGWVTVVRGLPGFTGDELAWRVWLLACARQRAEEGTLRRSWGAVTVLPGVRVQGDGDIDIDELLEPEDTLNPSHRGLTDTLTALRALPLGQGEVVVLRLGAELPAAAVADVIGVEPRNIERAEHRAIERLGADAELLTWSLAAPPTPAELADEVVAVSAFRKVVSRDRRQTPTKVIAIGPARTRAGARHTSRSGSETASPTRRGSKIAGRSRTGALVATALSVSAMSLGGLGAAAYVGVLPDQVQQAMHDAVGAPAPGEHGRWSIGGGKGTADGNSATGGKGTKPHRVAPPTAAVGPSAAASAAAGLCRAWASDKTHGVARDRSVAFRNLSTTAGGADKVDAYCAVVLTTKPGKGSPTASKGKPSTGTHSTGKPSTGTPSTGKPSTRTPSRGKPSTGKQSTGTSSTGAAGGTAPHGTGSPTHTPKASTTVTPDSQSPTKEAGTTKPAKGRATKTSASETTEVPTTTDSPTPTARRG